MLSCCRITKYLILDIKFSHVPNKSEFMVSMLCLVYWFALIQNKFMIVN